MAHVAVAWKSTPAVSIIHCADALTDAPMATHTWPDFELNVDAGARNLSEAVVKVSAEGTGDTGADQAIVGAAAAAL